MNEQQMQQEPRVPFYLTGPMLDTIIGGLSQLSYQVAAPVIEDLRAQYMQHEQAAQAAAQAEQSKATEAAPEAAPETPAEETAE